MDEPFSPPEDVYGVVLSGDGGTAGTDTWLTHGVVTDGELQVERCAPATDWLGVEPARAKTLPALARFLASLPGTAAVGLDFPFGLPEPVVTEETWEEFVVEFPGWCNSPEDFRRRCERRAALYERATQTDDDGTARLRSTDRPVGSLSPYDESIAEFTFYGIRDVLRPLALSGAVCIPPMFGNLFDCESGDCASVLEVYPGGTLDDLDLFDPGYVGASEASRRMRQNILDELDGSLSTPSEVRVSLIESAAALKSLIAAYAVYRNTRTSEAVTFTGERRSLEGHIFI